MKSDWEQLKAGLITKDQFRAREIAEYKELKAKRQAKYEQEEKSETSKKNVL
jgi:hypothetical protein